MALNLSDFNKADKTKEEMRMEAFQPRVKSSPAANPATINTIATLGAALEPNGNLDSAYKGIANQLQYSTSSSVLDTIIKSWDENDVQGSMDTLRSVLVNPNLSDEYKQDVLYAFQTNQTPEQLGVKVAMSAAEADSEGETVEGSELRAMIAAGYDEVDSYNAWAQQQINALNSDANPGWHDNVKLLAESFVPFLDAADAAMFENLLSENVEEAGGAVNTLQTLFIMGEGKNRLREALDKMPVEQRKPVVQALIGTIKSMSGTITTNTSTLRAIRNLEQMVSINGYSQTDRWVDDFFSVLDATILLSPVRSIAGALKGTKSAALDAEILRRGAMAEESLAAAGEAPRASTEPLMIEYKPAPVSYGDDIENVINSLPIEPTSKEIGEIREAINVELGNPNGFSIDNVIDRMSAADRMTSSQIIDVRQAVGPIAIKRKNDLDGVLPTDAGDFAEVQRAHISGNVQPTSVSQIYKDVNPSKARVAHAAVVADTTGRAAELLYGTDRTSALANDILPDIGGGPRIRHKTEFDGVEVTPDPKILEHIKGARKGELYASKEEQASAYNKFIKGWKSVTGITPRTAMQTISSIKPEMTDVGNGVRINQVYGPKDSGFKDALAGMEVVKNALRNYGVKDSDLTVLSRQPDGLYGPVKDGQDLRNGDFVVQVKYDLSYDPADIGFDGYDIKPLWGWLPIGDLSITGKLMGPEGGTVQQVLPKFVNIDKNAYSAGVNAADVAGGIQEQFLARANRMAKKWKKLSKDQKNRVDQYIRLANDNEIPFSIPNIRANAGIKDDGIEVLQDWKDIQDTLCVLENADLNKTLRNRGFQYYINKSIGTELLVKPEAKGSRVYGRDYLLPDGTVGKYSDEQIEQLYAEGGYIASLRKPEDFNGETISHVIVKNNATEGYARRIRDDDTTLGYRHGYYHVKYTDTYYITKTENGVEKTIARADNKTDLNAELNRLRSMNDGAEYDFKYNRDLGMDARFDFELDIAFNTGRSSQRLRGKRLTRVGHDKTLSDAGMESPLDSMVRSIASISNRVAFRDVLEGEKRRWLSSFKHLLPKSEQYKFPDKITDIASGKGASNARHAWRHVDALESGYANRIDETAKWFFNTVADVSSDASSWKHIDKLGKGKVSGRAALEATEKKLRQAAKGSPSGLARFTAFRLFMSSAAAAQAILQTAPAVPILASLNPLGIGRVARQFPLLTAWKMGADLTTSMKVARASGLSLDEMAELIKDYELSGMSAAVSSHSFMADRMAELADKNRLQKLWSAANVPLDISEKIGFRFGEQTLMDLVWLSERDRMSRKLGRKNLDARERSELTVKARALTGDMNRGGDMPYNSNSFSVFLQFMQNPHKIASSLILGHRNLSRSERLRLAAGYTLTFGVPPVLFIDTIVDTLIPAEEKELADAVKGGLTNIILNRFLSSLSGEPVSIEFSERLQPFSTEPLIDFLGDAIKLSIPEVISGRAAPSLITDGGRVSNFIQAMLAPLIPGQYEGVDEMQQIALTFGQMFTGVSNTMKALYAFEMGKLMSAKGATVDEEVSFFEAMAKHAGFQTTDEMRYWEGNIMMWEMSDRPKEDVKQWMDQLFSMYARQGMDPTDLQHMNKVFSSAMVVWKDRPAIMNLVAEEYKMRLRNNPDIAAKLIKEAGLYDPAEVNRLLNNTTIPSDVRETVMQFMRSAGEAYGD